MMRGVLLYLHFHDTKYLLGIYTWLLPSARNFKQWGLEKKKRKLKIFVFSFSLHYSMKNGKIRNSFSKSFKPPSLGVTGRW